MDDKESLDLFDDVAADEVYDPLADDEDIDGFEADPQAGPISFEEAMREHKPRAVYKKDDTRTALDKVRDLLDSSNDQRSTFLAVIDFCRKPVPVCRVNEEIDRLRAGNHTVYSAANITSLLERAQGLEKVDEAGNPYAQSKKGEATVVEVDGVRYAEPGKAPQVYWLSTSAGVQVLEEDDPFARLCELFDSESRVIDLYLRVLLMSSREEGATAKELTSVVDMDPLAQDPVVTAPHFSIALKKCGAIKFNRGWHVTNLGKRALREIFSIDDESLASEIASVENNAVSVPDKPTQYDDPDNFYCGD